MPAQRLEKAAPNAKRVGRLQEGARADIVVFDAQGIQDRASFRAPTQASVGVRYLVVAGTLVVDDGHIVEGVAPGQAFVRNIDSRQQGRHRVPAGAVLHSEAPLPIAGAISLGGIADLWSFHELKERACGDGVIRLTGGTSDNATHHDSQASPAELLPMAVPHLLIHGVDDRNMPLPHVQAYADLAHRRGDDVTLVVIPQAAHFELMAPWSKAWPRIQAPLFELLRAIKSRGTQGGSPN